MRSAVLSVLFLATSVFAAPSKVMRRQSSTTCGSNYYSSSQVSDALNQGYGDYQDGNSPDDYPHTYNNYEGFNFPVSGPYQEFPILESGPFSGGSPGADRVIFNEQGQYAGAITHTGASTYDGFVGCSGTS